MAEFPFDVQEVVHLLPLTVSDDREAGQAAEERLKEHYNNQPGFTVCLFQLAMSDDVDDAVRLSGVIYLKNLLHHYYDAPHAKNAEVQIGEESRAFLRQNALQAMVHAPRRIKSFMELVFKSIVKIDFPEKLPTLLDEIEECLNSGDSEAMFGAVLAILQIAETYEWRSRNRREPFDALVERFFPSLASLMASILEVDTEEAVKMQSLILKVYWCSFQLQQPACLRRIESMTTWMELFAGILTKTIPLGLAAQTESDINQYPWYAVKRQVMEIINRLFHRYGQPDLIAEDEHEKRAFAEFFRDQIAPSIVEMLLFVLGGWVNGERDVASLVLREMFVFLDACVRHSVTFAVLKNNLQTLYTDILFPVLCVSDEDLQEWAEDPRFYVKRTHNVFEDFISPVTAAITVVVELAKVRPQWGIPLVTQYAQHIFEQQAANPSDESISRAKSGALLSLAAVAPKLITLSDYKDGLEELLTQAVVTDLDSPFAYLRMRASYTLGAYWDISFTSPEVHQLFLTKVFETCHDDDLAVRISAGLALQKLIKPAGCDDYVRPMLADVLKTLLNLMGEIDSDDLVNALEAIILRFGADVAQLAIPIAGSLAELLEASLNAEKSAADIEDEFVFGGNSPGLASLNCARTLNTLLSTLRYHSDVYSDIEEVVGNTMVRLTSPEGMDLMEEIMDMVATMTEYTDTPSDFMWDMLSRFVAAHFEFAFDYTRELLNPLCNMAKKAPEVLVTIHDGELMTQLVNMYERLVADPEVAEYDSQYGCRLAEVLLLTLGGHIDDFIPRFIDAALYRLSTARTNALRVLCTEVVLRAFWYNPELTAAYLSQSGNLTDYFDALQQLWDNYSRFEDKKTVLLTFARIFEVPLSSYPDDFQALLPTVFAGLFAMSQALMDQIDHFESERERLGLTDFDPETAFADDAEAWGKDPGIGDDEDLVDIRQVRYMDMLHEQYEGYEAMLREDEDGDFADDNDPALPTNSIHELDFVVTAIRSFIENQPEAATQLFQTLDSNPSDLIDAMSTRAEEEKRKEAEEAMKDLANQVKLMTPEVRAQYEAARANGTPLTYDR